MRRREVSVEDMLERQSVEYLREVVREVRTATLTDPFFDRVKASCPLRRVKPAGGGWFTFRFDPLHRGRPWLGQSYALAPGSMSLKGPEGGTALLEDLTVEHLLDAIREMVVAEVMEL